MMVEASWIFLRLALLPDGRVRRWINACFSASAAAAARAYSSAFSASLRAASLRICPGARLRNQVKLQPQ